MKNILFSEFDSLKYYDDELDNNESYGDKLRYSLIEDKGYCFFEYLYVAFKVKNELDYYKDSEHIFSLSSDYICKLLGNGEIKVKIIEWTKKIVTKEDIINMNISQEKIGTDISVVFKESIYYQTSQNICIDHLKDLWNKVDKNSHLGISHFLELEVICTLPENNFLI